MRVGKLTEPDLLLPEDKPKEGISQIRVSSKKAFPARILRNRECRRGGRNEIKRIRLPSQGGWMGPCPKKNTGGRLL